MTRDSRDYLLLMHIVVACPLKYERGTTSCPRLQHAYMVIRPKERLAEIQLSIGQDLAKWKEKDQKWEDYVDVRVQFTFK